MTTRSVQRYRSAATADALTAGRLTRSLGLFSNGVGLTKILAPRAVSALIGVRDGSKTRTILRLYGLWGLAAGVRTFPQPRPAGWLWARVAVDLTSLLKALGGRGNGKARVALGIASHHIPLDDAPRGYSTFRNNEDSCEKIVLKPN